MIINGEERKGVAFETGTKMYFISVPDDENVDIRLIVNNKKTNHQNIFTSSGIRIPLTDLEQFLTDVIGATGMPFSIVNLLDIDLREAEDLL